VEDIQPDSLGTITDCQSGKLVPARDDDQRTRAAGDHWPYLTDVRHIVEHDQDAAIGDKRTEHGSPAVKVCWDR
jgi:hypothetical protein